MTADTEETPLWHGTPSQWTNFGTYLFCLILAAGMITADSAYHLAERLGVDLPISGEVYRVLFEQKPVNEAVRAVLSRPLKRD